MGKKLTQEEFEERLKKYPDIASVGEYVSSKTKIDITYVCGHTGYAIPGNLIDRGDCSFCRVCTPVIAYNRKTEKELTLLLDKYVNIKSISGYTGNKANIEITYVCGHIKNVIASTLLNQGANSICRICTPTVPVNKISQDTFESRLEQHQEIQVVGDYTDNKTDVDVTYKCGHTNNAQAGNLMHHGTNATCRICNPSNTSKGERDLGDYIEKYYNIIRNDRSILGGKIGQKINTRRI